MHKAFLLLCAAGVCAAQSYTPGPQVLTFFSEVDDSDQPYALYLPKSFDPAKKYPLVVSLHGAGSNHRLNLRRVFGRGNLPMETDAQASRYFPGLREVDFIVASPYARGTMGYQGIPEKDVYDVLADVKRRFPIDEDRVYLTGLSMGGGGTLWLGLTRPDVWAAIAPVCAAMAPGAAELAGNAVNVPVHLFHGDQDPAVPVQSSRDWHKRFLELGVRAEYVEYPGVRHNSWDLAYKDAAIFDWFAKFRRERNPSRVRFSTRAHKYNSAYWVELDSFTPGALASIDARFDGKDRVAVETTALDGFTLKLPARAVTVAIDGEQLRTKGGTVSFTRAGKAWRIGRSTAEAKRPGAEGPLSEVIAGRHIYVYGTADKPGPEELKRRHEIAAQAADWSGPRGRLLLNLLVKADREVTPRDIEESNLVLFGTKETNGLIARFADRLPLELNAGAADYGLVFAAPAGNRYVAVNSGLPWWTGADEARRVPGRYGPLPWRVLLSFEDFVLFKGSLQSVVAEGRFSRQWKAEGAALEKLRASSTVTIR